MNNHLQQINHCEPVFGSFSFDVRSSRRRGFASMEILVSALIICATATAVTSLLFKCGMVWRDVSQRRVAVHELSAQLEELTLMESDSVAEKIEQLKPSTICSQRLHDAKLTGVLVEDKLGVRIELSINWKRAVESKPIVLCGWLIESEESE